MRKQKWFIVILLIPLLMTCSKDKSQVRNLISLKSGQFMVSIQLIENGKYKIRTAQIVCPASFDENKKYPLVFAFHGAGGSSDRFLENDILNEYINAGEFVGIYPNGHSQLNEDGGFWNLSSTQTIPNDLDFINQLISLLTSTNVDFDKMYAIGISNGGGMVNLLGKSTSHFKAIAPLFNQQLLGMENMNAPSPISVYQVNGEDDDLIPVDGGVSSVGEYMSAENSALNWSNSFSCDTNAITEYFKWGNVNLYSNSYMNCENGNEIKYIIALQQGHGIDDKEADEDMYREIWEFFKKH